MPQDIEYKSFLNLTKAVDGRIVTGLTAGIGNIDAYGDIIHRGSFKKTILEQAGRIRHLWQHDSQRPPIAAVKELREIGRGEIPKPIKEKYPDLKGALEVTREYLNTPRAEEVFEGIQTGAISEMSIGYSPVKWDYDENDDGLVIRNLREIRLFDTSDVNWGANAATAAVKTALDFKLSKLGDYALAMIEEINAANEAENIREIIQYRVGELDLPDLVNHLKTLTELLAAEPQAKEPVLTQTGFIMSDENTIKLKIAAKEIELMEYQS